MYRRPHGRGSVLAGGLALVSLCAVAAVAWVSAAGATGVGTASAVKLVSKNCGWDSATQTFEPLVRVGRNTSPGAGSTNVSTVEHLLENGAQVAQLSAGLPGSMTGIVNLPSQGSTADVEPWGAAFGEPTHGQPLSPGGKYQLQVTVTDFNNGDNFTNVTYNCKAVPAVCQYQMIVLFQPNGGAFDKAGLHAGDKGQCWTDLIISTATAHRCKYTPQSSWSNTAAPARAIWYYDDTQVGRTGDQQAVDQCFSSQPTPVFDGPFRDGVPLAGEANVEFEAAAKIGAGWSRVVPDASVNAALPSDYEELYDGGTCSSYTPSCATAWQSGAAVYGILDSTNGAISQLAANVTDFCPKTGARHLPSFGIYSNSTSNLTGSNLTGVINAIDGCTAVAVPHP